MGSSSTMILETFFWFVVELGFFRNCFSTFLISVAKRPSWSANLVFINTCSIREKAEQTVRKRLEFYNSIKKNANKNMIVGVLGCMAERLN